MQLLSMEVNQLGNADRTNVGPLTAGLNAVCGRRGSGKTAIVSWLRGIINAPTSSSQAPAAQLASGRVTMRLADGEYQIERLERAGRTSSKILRRAAHTWNGQQVNGHHGRNGNGRPSNGHAPSQANGRQFDDHWNGLPERLQTGLQTDLISQLQQHAFERLTAIPSDSQATYRLWDLARELRLDESDQPLRTDERSMLLAREHELTAQLQPLENIAATREGLLARRRQLEADLDRARRQSGGKYYAPATDEHHRLSDRLSAMDRDCEALRANLAEVDAAIARLRDGQIVDTKQNSYREQLLSLDAQLARWRNTLTEIRAHRERLESASTDAHLDGQLGEQFTPVNQATPRLALRSLEAQILEARRHFDALVEGVDRYRGDTHDSVRHELPQTLRLMQHELHEVCQQLSRHESLSTNRAMKDQIQQLARCESEMKLAVERLIVERGELLRTIATACQLSVDQVSLAYSDTCRCADHPHLDAWLNAVGTGPLTNTKSTSIHPKFFDELADLESRRKHLLAQLESAERDRLSTDSRLRHLGVAPLASGNYDRVEAELLRELDLVNEDILRLETRDRLRVDLVDVRRRLQHLPHEVSDAGSLRGRYLRHLAGLTGSPVERATHELFRDQLVRDALQPNHYAYDRRALDARYGAPMVDGRYEPVRGHYMADQLSHATPDTRIARLEEVALRLAVADVLSAKGHPIPLVMDETLDGLQGPHLLTAMRYLAGHADVAHQQVILMTDDQQLAEAVKSVRGQVVSIALSHTVAAPPTPVAPVYVNYDVNRQLTAYANDYETEKWHEPEWTPPPVVRPEVKKRWVLTERSEIQEVPSIGTVTAARLRTLGIHRVGDLLDADPESLAHAARLSGVDAEVIRAWQSECRLLCAMPQLRPFDARVMAGAGVRDHRQLNEMEPARLLERVENFLATERGKQIMRSGTPNELSRLTAWVASAKHGTSDRQRESSTFDMPARAVPVSRRPARSRMDDAHDAVPTYHIVERDDLRDQRDDNRTPRQRGERRSRDDRSTERNGEREGAERDAQSSNRRERTTRSNGSSHASNGAKGSSQRDSDNRLKFYLEPASPVVDAPSIGASMARSLEEVGVVTIQDLLNVNADELSADLGQPRVTGAVIRAWQEQSRLVCRIPNLRGHDAQILVACGITTPEALTRIEPTALLAQTTAFAGSTQGQRVLRGSQAPDLDEVKQWISWAANSRNLIAA